MSQVDLQTLLSTIYAAPSMNAQGQQFSQGIGPAASIAARTMPQQQMGQPWQAPNLDNLLLNILPRWGGSSTGGSGTGGSTTPNNPGPFTPPGTRPPTTGGVTQRDGGPTGNRNYDTGLHLWAGHGMGGFTGGTGGRTSGSTGGGGDTSRIDSLGNLGLGRVLGSSDLGKSIGLDPNGSMDWQQALDIAGDALGFTGDMWANNLNQINGSEVLSGILDFLVPGAGSLPKELVYSTLANKLGVVPEWLKDLVLKGDIIKSEDANRRKMNEDSYVESREDIRSNTRDMSEQINDRSLQQLMDQINIRNDFNNYWSGAGTVNVGTAEAVGGGGGGSSSSGGSSGGTGGSSGGGDKDRLSPGTGTRLRKK